MVQGWRPYSATNQPSSQAIQGAGSIHSAHLSSHGCRVMPPGLSVLQKLRANSASITHAESDHDAETQNIGATRGTVLSTACWIIAGVAWRTSTTYFFSSSPKPRSALCCTNRCKASASWRFLRRASSATTAWMPLDAPTVLGLDLLDARNLLVERAGAYQPMTQGISMAQSLACLASLGQATTLKLAGAGSVSTSPRWQPSWSAVPRQRCSPTRRRARSR